MDDSGCDLNVEPKEFADSIAVKSEGGRRRERLMKERKRKEQHDSNIFGWSNQKDGVAINQDEKVYRRVVWVDWQVGGGKIGSMIFECVEFEMSLGYTVGEDHLITMPIK